jgi:hypothetical protein
MEEVRKFFYRLHLGCRLTANVLSRGHSPVVRRLHVIIPEKKKKPSAAPKDKGSQKGEEYHNVHIRPVRHTRPGRNRVWISVWLV